MRKEIYFKELILEITGSNIKKYSSVTTRSILKKCQSKTTIVN